MILRFFDESVFIPIKGMLKQFRVNKNSLSILIYAFPHDSAICPCATLKHYVDRTKNLRRTNTQLY